MIHVQSNSHEHDDNEELDNDQVQTTKKSLKLLDENNGYQSIRAATPVFGDDDTDRKVANIHI